MSSDIMGKFADLSHLIKVKSLWFSDWGFFRGRSWSAHVQSLRAVWCSQRLPQNRCMERKTWYQTAHWNHYYDTGLYYALFVATKVLQQPKSPTARTLVTQTFFSTHGIQWTTAYGTMQLEPKYIPALKARHRNQHLRMAQQHPN